LAAVLAGRPASVTCEFEDIRRYREAVAIAREAGVSVGLATLRITKPGEEGFLHTIAGHQPDFVLVRNLAALHVFREQYPSIRRIGDFSLNVANELTAELFLAEGLERLTPSYDLNWEQFRCLAGRTDAGRLEAVIHQHMPMFHNEHCVFAATLSQGKDHRDCGRPCDRHQVDLRDRTGARFPLLADVGCRNTLFNAVPQSAAEYLPRMRALGIRHFRIELLRESSADAENLLRCYHRVLSGDVDGGGLWRQLRAMNQLGVTRGTLSLA
jgi:putative protease